MISVFDKKEDCCGCTMQAYFPTKSIEMKSDEEHFLYPEIPLCQDSCRRVLGKV
jgi:hypothetical protein